MSLKPSVLRFKFDDFASLPSETGHAVCSEKLTDIRGNHWALVLFPGGNSDGGEGDLEDPYVGVYLSNIGAHDVFAARSFILRDALGGDYCECMFPPRILKAEGRTYGSDDFVKRSEILDADNNIIAKGALHIDVELRFRPEEISVYIPPISLANRMLQLLENKDDADASFRVEDDVITAHKAILRMNSPVLFDSCEESDDGSPIPIGGVSPRIFRIVLRYIYGGEVPGAGSIEESGKDIIDAANRFGVMGLKLAVESALIESLTIHSGNLLDWLIFADAKTCPLLKEYAMSYCVARSADLFGWKSWKTLKESPDLMEELMMEISKSLNGDDRFDDGRNVSVNDLRKQLHGRGLDVDGSKEMLVSRLEKANKRQRTE